MHKIITRSEAKDQGLKHYFTGSPCKRGHVDQRWTSSAKCFSCHYEETPIKGFYGKSKEHKKALAKARAKKWYGKNRELTIKRAAKWKAENPDRVKEISKAEGIRLRSTPDGKCIVFMRDSLRRCMRNKIDRTSDILGYTKEELVAHIERQFVRGMTWDNHGDWHIDHIIPVSWHVKSGETDPKVINALTNLKPMWAFENNSKGSRREVLL